MAVGVASILAYVLTRNITRSIGEVLAAARGLAQGEGDLTRRIAVRGRDELGELALGFNAFLARWLPVPRPELPPSPPCRPRSPRRDYQRNR